MSDELRRLETLERLVRHLTREVGELRAEVRGRAAEEGVVARAAERAATREAAASPASSPAVEAEAPMSPRPTPPPAQPRVDWSGIPMSPAPRPALAGGDLEKLVGRYGTVALAVLTIVMGVGVFLRWAVEHVQLSDAMRVTLGGIGAVAVGVFGWRLRRRAKQYGDTLVGLSLALVHVVAWGAGPYLRVVPERVALAVAAAASVLLAILAWREREQPLFAAGLGGAFLAPFVTTRSAGTPEALLTYGAPLVVSATLALGRGDWRVARRLLAAGTLLFAGAALAALPDGSLWWRLAEAPAFALGAAVVAQLAVTEQHRRALVYNHLASALVVMVAFASSEPPVQAAAALALVGAIVAALASRGEGDAAGGTFELAISGTGTFSVGAPSSEPVPWVGAVGFPIAFMVAALFAMADPATTTGATVAAAFAIVAALFAASAWQRGVARRGAHVAAAGFAVIVALLLGAEAHPVVLAGLLAGTGVALALLAARTVTPLALVPGLLALALATATAGMELALRPAWSYTPFLTPASLAAAMVVAAWWGAARATTALVAACPRPAGLPVRRSDDTVVLRAAAFVAAFLWGHQELRHAGSPALATFLLVAYYATCGVVTIGIGRLRGSAPARRTGLALAVLAALKAIVQASAITGIGMRVGSYLLVGGFLLGVAWWYRSGEGEAVGEDSPPSPEPRPSPARTQPGAPVAAPDAGPGVGDPTVPADALAPARPL